MSWSDMLHIETNGGTSLNDSDSEHAATPSQNMDTNNNAYSPLALFENVHPCLWTRWQVQKWLEWCTREFAFIDIQSEKFSMNGKALMLMDKEDFVDRAPYAGSILFKSLQQLLKKHEVNGVSDSLQESSQIIRDAECTNTARMYLAADACREKLRGNSIYPGFNPIHPPPFKYSTRMPMRSCIKTDISPIYLDPDIPILQQHSEHQSQFFQPQNECRLLWEFLAYLLNDIAYCDLICWVDAIDFRFRIVNPSKLSLLWGIQKNRTNMTYEKLSRALRYYYRMGILEKVTGSRLTYRFLKPPNEIHRGQKATVSPKGSSQSDTHSHGDLNELDDDEVRVLDSVTSDCEKAQDLTLHKPIATA